MQSNNQKNKCKGCEEMTNLANLSSNGYCHVCQTSMKRKGGTFTQGGRRDGSPAFPQSKARYAEENKPRRKAKRQGRKKGKEKISALSPASPPMQGRRRDGLPPSLQTSSPISMPEEEEIEGIEGINKSLTQAYSEWPHSSCAYLGRHPASASAGSSSIVSQGSEEEANEEELEGRDESRDREWLGQLLFGSLKPAALIMAIHSAT